MNLRSPSSLISHLNNTITHHFAGMDIGGYAFVVGGGKRGLPIDIPPVH